MADLLIHDCAPVIIKQSTSIITFNDSTIYSNRIYRDGMLHYSSIESRILYGHSHVCVSMLCMCVVCLYAIKYAGRVISVYCHYSLLCSRKLRIVFPFLVLGFGDGRLGMEIQRPIYEEKLCGKKQQKPRGWAKRWPVNTIFYVANSQ